MAESSESRGNERVTEAPRAESRACESAREELTQDRQSATEIGSQLKEQSRRDTGLLESQGKLPVCSVGDGNGSSLPASPKTPDEKKSGADADGILRGFSISQGLPVDASAGDRIKAADASPVRPFDLTASEFRDMLKAGPQKGIDSSCSTVPQSPAVSKKEVQNTCGIDLKSKYPDVQKGVVQVYGEGGRVGTGFLACEKDTCRIVTDEHVVGNTNQVLIVKDGKLTPGTVTGRDPGNDLASVSIDSRRLPGLKPLPLASGTDLAAGAPVFAVGHGRQMPEQSIVAGTITKPSVDIQTRDGDVYLNQFDSNMQAVSGHSGSPVLNKDGRVVGIIGSAGRTGTSGAKLEAVKELLRRR